MLAAEALLLVRSRRRSGCCAPPPMRVLSLLMVYSRGYSIARRGGSAAGALPKALWLHRSSAHSRAIAVGPLTVA